MASITRTKQGTWRVQIECKGTRRSKTLPTEAAAKVWADSVEGRLRAKAEFDAAAANTFLATMVPKRMLSALADAPYGLKEVLEAAIPAHTMTGIYFLIKDDEVVYIGQSVDVLHRIARHKRDGRDFTAFAYMLCERDELDRLEATYIAALMPWLNHSLGRIAG